MESHFAEKYSFAIEEDDLAVNDDATATGGLQWEEQDPALYYLDPVILHLDQQQVCSQTQPDPDNLPSQVQEEVHLDQQHHWEEVSAPKVVKAEGKKAVKDQVSKFFEDLLSSESDIDLSDNDHSSYSSSSENEDHSLVIDPPETVLHLNPPQIDDCHYREEETIKFEEVKESSGAIENQIMQEVVSDLDRIEDIDELHQIIIPEQQEKEDYHEGEFQVVREEEEEDVTAFQSHRDDDMLLDSEVEIEIESFENCISVSDVQVLNKHQHREEENEPKVELRPRRMQRPVVFARFAQSSQKLMMVTDHKGEMKMTRCQDFQSMTDMLLFESLHEMIKLDPVKLSKSDYARGKVCEMLNSYLDLVKDQGLALGEAEVWRMLEWQIQSKRNDEQSNWKRALSLKKEEIMAFLLEGKDFRDVFGHYPIQNSENHGQESRSESYRNSQAFDYSSEVKWQMSYEGLIQDMIRSSESQGNAILIAALLCDESQRKQLFSQYIQKCISHKNPLYTLLMIRIGMVGELFNNAQSKQVILQSWRTQVTFVLANMENSQVRHEDVREFISKVADFVLQDLKDTWSFLYLKIMICEPIHKVLITKCPQNSIKMNLTVNYIMTLYSSIMIEQGHKRHCVELSFYRGLIYSKLCGGKHDSAHEEYHSVIENREALEPRISKSQYFQFMIRELKQSEFELMRRRQSPQIANTSILKPVAKETPLKEVTPTREYTNSQDSKGEKSSSLKKETSPLKVEVSQPSLNESEQQQSSSNNVFFTGFKGLFRKVIGQQSNQKSLTSDIIVAVPNHPQQVLANIPFATSPLQVQETVKEATISPEADLLIYSGIEDNQSKDLNHDQCLPDSNKNTPSNQTQTQQEVCHQPQLQHTVFRKQAPPPFVPLALKASLVTPSLNDRMQSSQVAKERPQQTQVSASTNPFAPIQRSQTTLKRPPPIQQQYASLLDHQEMKQSETKDFI